MDSAVAGSRENLARFRLTEPGPGMKYEVLRAVSRDAECGLFPIRISSLCFKRKFSIFVARPQANWNSDLKFDSRKLFRPEPRVRFGPGSGDEAEY